LNLRGALTAGWRKLRCEKLNHLYFSPGVHKFRGTKFCTVAPNIFSVIIAVLFLTYKNGIILHVPEQKAPDIGEVYVPVQKYGSSVWNFFHVTLLAFGIWGRSEIWGGGDLCTPALNCIFVLMKLGERNGWNVRCDSKVNT
jgi:hypothetical protein